MQRGGYLGDQSLQKKILKSSFSMRLEIVTSFAPPKKLDHHSISLF